MTRHEILKDGVVITSTSNGLAWCEAVYPVRDGYVTRTAGACCCTANRICNTCYAKAITR